MNKILGAAAVLSMSLFACGPMTGTDAGTNVDAGTDAGTAAPTCASYCTSVMANCVGANAQYSSEAACLGSCSAFAAGASGATSGNTLGCRAYHAGASTADVVVHCPHAGPAGDATCGSNCESFCTVAIAKCAGTFTDLGACTTACAAFPTNAAHYNQSTTSGNSFACRMYHLSVAATDSTQATTHCPHITTVSATCM